MKDKLQFQEFKEISKIKAQLLAELLVLNELNVFDKKHLNIDTIKKFL